MIIDQLVPSASTYAADIDWIWELIFWLVGFWFVLSESVFFWLLWKFRKKDGQKAQYITGELEHEKKWITYPHLLVLVCDIFIVYGAVRVWYEVKQNLPEAQSMVRVVGQQWAWTFVHAGPDGALDTEDDITTINELRLAKDTLYHYKLESLDVLHNFSVPVFRLKQDSIPGREITGWFEPTLVGDFSVQCAEICGIGHGLMGARVIIETPEAHAAWMAAHSTSGLAEVSTPAEIPPTDVAANTLAISEE
jgi:cytochrome c oxidase subunit 2